MRWSPLFSKSAALGLILAKHYCLKAIPILMADRIVENWGYRVVTYLLYRIRWNIELFNKAAKSGCNLKSINSSKKNIILIFILLSLLVSLIKTYCAAKTMIRHKIDDLSLLKVHTYNVLYEKLLFAFAYRNRSTIYQVFKELLGEIALCCKRSKPSQRDRLLIKDLPLLLWQIVNQPGFKRKIS